MLLQWRKKLQIKKSQKSWNTPKHKPNKKTKENYKLLLLLIKEQNEKSVLKCNCVLFSFISWCLNVYYIRIWIGSYTNAGDSLQLLWWFMLTMTLFVKQLIARQCYWI